MTTYTFKVTVKQYFYHFEPVHHEEYIGLWVTIQAKSVINARQQVYDLLNNDVQEVINLEEWTQPIPVDPAHGCMG